MCEFANPAPLSYSPWQARGVSRYLPDGAASAGTALPAASPSPANEQMCRSGLIAPTAAGTERECQLPSDGSVRSAFVQLDERIRQFCAPQRPLFGAGTPV